MHAVGARAEEVQEQSELGDEPDSVLNGTLRIDLPQAQPRDEQRGRRREDDVLGAPQGRAEDDREGAQHHRVDRQHRDLGEAEVIMDLPAQLEGVVDREDERQDRRCEQEGGKGARVAAAPPNAAPRRQLAAVAPQTSRLVL